MQNGVWWSPGTSFPQSPPCAGIPDLLNPSSHTFWHQMWNVPELGTQTGDSVSLFVFLMGADHPGSLYYTETCRHSNLGFQSLANNNHGKPTGLRFFSKGKVCQYFSNFPDFSSSFSYFFPSSLLLSLLSSPPLSFLPPLLPSFSFQNWTPKLFITHFS